MFTAPAVVNSEATRAALLDECGLQALVRRARNVDVAVLSVGSMHPDATTFRYGRGMLPSDARKELIEAGAVGNMCFHFFDAEGRPVEHPINRRVMSVPIGDLHGVRHRLLVSGGEQKVEAIRAGMKLLDANVLITNESAARTLVERA
jgi:DNA-binding transcriptional regulator LsrR (DeoR family)